MLAAAVATLALASGAVAAGPRVTLTISIWADGDASATPRVWTLRCAPVGGTLPARQRACRVLGQGGWDLFEPVPGDAVCMEIYGGPQVALVRGRLGDRRVWARFTRTDGCQIARWTRLAALLPLGVS